MAQKRKRRRLNGYDRHKRRIASAETIVCHDCGRPIDPSLPKNRREALTIDHVIPKCLHGRSTKENLLPAHRYCNENRGAVAQRILKDLKRLGLVGKAD